MVGLVAEKILTPTLNFETEAEIEMDRSYFDEGEVRQMEETAICLRDKLLIRLLFRLGCRVSEALALSTKDIDFTRGLVTIVHLKSRPRLFCPICKSRLCRNHSFCHKCGEKMAKAMRQEQEQQRLRTLPLDSETLDLLSEYIQRGGLVLKN